MIVAKNQSILNDFEIHRPPEPKEDKKEERDLSGSRSFDEGISGERFVERGPSGCCRVAREFVTGI